MMNEVPAIGSNTADFDCNFDDETVDFREYDIDDPTCDNDNYDVLDQDKLELAEMVENESEQTGCNFVISYRNKTASELKQFPNINGNNNYPIPQSMHGAIAFPPPQGQIFSQMGITIFT
ncbi:hypothetical protein MXB_2680 [Myxobolus squamalis]|nr:hypothetical protein MXB_2680 [Myxobolus squamalis]